MTRTRISKRVTGFVTAAILGLGLLPAAAFADPPHWAPAHGWRAKHYQHDHYRDRHRHNHRHVERRYERNVTNNYYYGQPQQHYGGGSALSGSGFGCNSDLIGALVGGAAGAALGSQFGKGDGKTAAIIGGAVIGLIAGNSIGSSMDASDRRCVSQTLERVPDGQPVVWQDPNRHGTGYPAQQSITPTRTWQTDNGRYCREYVTTGTIGRQVQEVYGTACRNPDGSWQIVS
ncbi:MAG: RT0821/Lpp0805 family surface protein [Alphaproteobacteria bacterium]